MNPFDSDLEIEEPSSDEEFNDDGEREVLKKCRQPLGLNRQYVQWWKPSHAIREFYQNWKDAIKEAAKLGKRNFIVIDNGFDTKDVYTVEARHPDTKTLLGYIRWSKGTLEFANFGAQLSRKTLDLGVSSKRKDENMAGTHGEGFKIGALVMVARGYRVRYEASSFYWNFQFGGRNKDHLYCKLSPIKSEKVEKQISTYKSKSIKGGPRALKANIWEDVSVKMGKVLGRGTPIEKHDLQKWINVSLDLSHPSKMLTTKHGDLILDETFQGKIYLKGLLMEGASAKQWKFSYNFFKGKTNRDRQRLTDPIEEAEILSKIWGEAIELDEKSTLPLLLDMLQSEQLLADVDLAEDTISIDTAKKIWKELLAQDPEQERFMYYVENGDKDVEVISKGLKKEPFAVKKSVWVPLRRYNLIRTPDEQMRYLLENAPASQVHSTIYSEGAQRALRSVLALDERTKNLQILFRDGNNIELDILLKDNDLLINDKWLNFNDSHSTASCYLSRAAAAQNIEVKQFSCSHILTGLYDLILVELSKNPSNGNNSGQTRSQLRQIVSEKLQQLPYKVEATTGAMSNQIQVTWIHPESRRGWELYNLEWQGKVTLHRESTCSARRLDLLADKRDIDESDFVNPVCGCPQTVVALKDSNVSFNDLDCDEDYFPMVCGMDFQAFFAFPPAAVRPKSNIRFSTTPLQQTLPQRTVTQSPAPKEEYNFGGGPSLYGASSVGGDDDDDVAMDPGTPDNPPPPSSQSSFSGPERSPARDISGYILPKTPSKMPNQEVTRLEAEITSVAHDLQVKDQEIQALKFDIANKTNELARLQNQVDDLSTQLRSSIQSNSKLKTEIQTANIWSADAKKHLDSITGQLTTAEAQLREKQAEIAIQRQCLEEHVQEIMMKDSQLDKAKIKTEQLTQNVNDLKTELEYAQLTASQSQAEIDTLRAELLALQNITAMAEADEQAAKIQALESKIRDLKLDLGEQTSKAETTKADLDNTLKTLRIVLNDADAGGKRKRIKLEGGGDEAARRAGNIELAKERGAIALDD